MLQSARGNCLIYGVACTRYGGQFSIDFLMNQILVAVYGRVNRDGIVLSEYSTSPSLAHRVHDSLFFAYFPDDIERFFFLQNESGLESVYCFQTVSEKLQRVC